MSHGLCANQSHSRKASVTPNLLPRRCAHCRRPFLPERTTARYCSPKCRVMAWRIRQGGTV